MHPKKWTEFSHCSSSHLPRKHGRARSTYERGIRFFENFGQLIGLFGKNRGQTRLFLGVLIETYSYIVVI